MIKTKQPVISSIRPLSGLLLFPLLCTSGCLDGAPVDSDEHSPTTAVAPLVAPTPPPLPPEPLIHFDLAPARDFTRDAQSKPFPSERTSSDGRLTFRYKMVPRASTGTTERTNCLIANQVEHDANGNLDANNCAPGEGEPLDIDQLIPADEFYMPFNLAFCNTERPNDSQNPYACDQYGQVAEDSSQNVHDCYDQTLVYTSYALNGNSRLYRLRGREITVVVDNPKTPAATVSAIHYNGGYSLSPYPGNDPSGLMPNMSEPTITADGRLLILHEANIGRGLRYSYIPDTGDACDVTQWDSFQSIASMHVDSEVNQRYKLARYPLRDFENVAFAPGEVINGQYQWVDPDGANLFFTYANRTLFYCEENSVYSEKGEDHCILGARFESAMDDDGFTSGTPISLAALQAVVQKRLRQGMTMVGFWSRGKMVAIDSRINSSDFAISEQYAADSSVGTAEIYAQDGATDIWTSDIVSINSPIDFYNFQDEYTPRLPNDVVWKLSSSMGTEEHSFDDFLDEDALIITHGTPVISRSNQLQDGWLTWFSGPTPFGSGWVGGALLENAATAFEHAAAAHVGAAQRLAIPPHAELSHTARVEPISRGGVHGKGVFLNSDGSHFLYRIPGQPDPQRFSTATWYTSFHINPTSDIANTEACKRMVDFPDGSFFGLMDNQHICFGRGWAQQHDLNIHSGPQGPLELSPTRWSHFGLESDGHDFKIYVDGYLFHRGTFAGMGTLFTYGNGTQEVVLKVGGQVAAWLDEFKVIARSQLPEAACNHAGGTLVEDLDHPQADAYPGYAHDPIGSGEYYCETRKIAMNEFVELGDSAYVCLGKTRFDAGPECVGQANLLGSVPAVQFDQPRPDATGNAFCTSCHSNNWAHPAMNIDDALQAGAPGVLAWQDPRRQPTQPAPRIFGYVPNAFFGDNLDFVSPADGVSVDVFTQGPNTIYPYHVSLYNHIYWVSVVNVPNSPAAQNVDVEWQRADGTTFETGGLLHAQPFLSADFIGVSEPSEPVVRLRVRLDKTPPEPEDEFSQWIDLP